MRNRLALTATFATALITAIVSAVLFRTLWDSWSEGNDAKLSTYENTERAKDEDVVTLQLQLEEQSAAFGAYRTAVNQALDDRQMERVEEKLSAPSSQPVTGYVWLGNDSTTNVQLITNPKSLIQQVKPGDELRSLRDLAIREKAPSRDGERSDVLGQMGIDTKFIAIDPPVVAPGTTTGADQYWIKTTVSLERRNLTSLYYPQDLEGDKDLTRMVDWLVSSGFRVDKKQVYRDRPITQNEVLACHSVDADRAEKLIRLIDRARLQGEFPGVKPTRSIRMNPVCSKRTAPGRLELYVKHPVYLSN